MEHRKTRAIKKKGKTINGSLQKPQGEEFRDQTSQLHPVMPLVIKQVVQALKDVEQLPCSLKQVCDLPEDKKQLIKISHPKLAPYYYLKKRQRSKLFHQINQKYRKAIKPLQPPGSAPKKKIIKFKKRFQVKLFDKNQNSKKIKQKKGFTQRQMRNVHFT